jgi:hypothetical protein
MKPNRIVSWFSGGAASAAATRLAITNNARTQNRPLVVVRIGRTKASADEMRFISECEKWFGVPVLQLHQRKPSSITRMLDFVALRRIPTLYRLRLRDVRRVFEAPGDLIGIDIPNTCRIGLSEGQKGPVGLRSSPGCSPKQLPAKVSADFSG